MGFSDELYHYGVKGMKWGVIRTPEQLGHPAKKKTKKVAASISEKLKQKKADSEAKKAKDEAKRRQKYLNSPTLLFKHRKMFTKEEIDKSLKQFEWEKKLYQYSADERKRGKEIANTALDYVDTAIRAYNTGASVYNAYQEGQADKSKLPIVSTAKKDGGGDKKKKNKKKKKKTVLEQLADYSEELAESYTD